MSETTHAASLVAGDVAEIKRILFVDDEQSLLDGLRDALRPYRRRWTMTFVTSGTEALAAIEAAPPDVVISDLRMPGMDGATLLERVRDQCPGAVRIVLSGHADMRIVGRAAGAAHRLIAKPCETAELARVIQRSCALQDMGARVALNRRAMGASVLPSVPRVCAELTELLSSGTAGAADAAVIIEHDIAMAAKVLQLANSAYFGRRSPVSRVTDAVAYLGFDAIRALALHAAAFQEFQVDPPIPGFDLDELHRHCTRVARLADALAIETGAGREAFTAGLLHDVGLLVMASQDRHALAGTLAIAHEQGRPIQDVEYEQYGVTHAEVGAHLLALWGLPHTVTEGVAGHNNPRWLDVPFDTVAAIYVANAIVEELETELGPDPLPSAALDLEYLHRAGLTNRVPHWRELAMRQFHESGA